MRVESWKYPLGGGLLDFDFAELFFDFGGDYF